MLNLIQFVTLFLVLFPKWGEGATAFQNLPLPIYNVGSLPRMLVKGTIVNKNFPTLRGTISMNERQHLT